MPRTSAGTRVSSIDAARGAAMVLVCLSHFLQAYVGIPGSADTGLIAGVHRLTFIATPTFMVISGAMLGLLYGRNAHAFDPIRAKLVDRGLFLLIVGHVLSAPPHYVLAGSWAGVMRYEFITDTIGCCLIAGCFLVPRLSWATRVVVGILLYATSCGVVALWHPDAPALGAFKDLVVGPRGASFWRYNFPLVPWFGVYLASSAIGQWIAGRAERRALSSVVFPLALGGTLALSTTLLADSAIHLFAGRAWISPGTFDFLHRLASPSNKWPPSPGYIVGYGGAGLVLLATVIAADAASFARPVLRWLALLGRTSLMIFVLEYYLYLVILEPAHLSYVAWWPVYFLLSLVFVTWAASAWDAWNGNRFFTVGYGWIGRRLQRIAGTAVIPPYVPAE